ncbi:VOC family protein [Aurantimonas sp. A2-1-M11]|uniref:VOC family protein n=1 Tax=Aurantimonas sp. A2-1-M11 TaxID=3113712 RepID=UPI002F959785
MTRLIFINLPVAELSRAVAFYEAVGAERNPHFSNETAACMVFSETIHVMLLTHARFREFTSKPIADAHASTQMLHCTSVESRDTVDAVIGWASEAGGKADPGPKQDHGFMYMRSFEDPDGHTWEVMWMEPAAVPANTEMATA